MRRLIGRRGRKMLWFDSGAVRIESLFCLPALGLCGQGSLASLDGCGCVSRRARGRAEVEGVTASLEQASLSEKVFAPHTREL